MYHVQLHFWVRGIDEKIVRIWQEAEPLERFTHLFHNFGSMQNVVGCPNVVNS